jgi:NADPH:quinone reductase-like Zn-dependent oxidoreductase
MGDIFGYGFGGFAEYAAAPEKFLSLKPSRLSFEEAAALPLAGMTVLQALRNMGNIQKGQKILIVGSSGGVGTLAVQLAKHFGMIVTGVCSSKNVEQKNLLGADKVIDYKKEDFGKDTGVYDLILAVNGSYPLSKYMKCLNRNGKYVMVGGKLSQILRTLFFGKLMSLGSRKMSFLFAKSNQKDLETLCELAQEGSLKPVIEKVYPLENTGEAMQYAAEGHASGKLVIKVR